MARFDRKLLQDDVDGMSAVPDECVTAENYLEVKFADALALLLPVLDEAAPQQIDGKEQPCAVCGDYELQHTTSDCPVKAALDAGLGKEADR